jgi:hypothetical protein
MLKNSDYIYTIGNSHKTCDDFAYSYTDNGINLSIVSDGCSSSRNSDIGARLICSKILDSLCSWNNLMKQGNVNEIIENCFEIIFNKYHKIYGDYFLDCTIITSITDNLHTVVYLIGDGCILCKYNNGTETYFNTEFENNAPAYMSYVLNTERQNAYLDFSRYYEETLITRSINKIDISTETKTENKTMDGIPVRSYSFSHNEVKYLMLFTDGINSFTDKSKDLSYYGHKMLDVKNENGVFLQRQIQGICRHEKETGNIHDDDFSGIALIF